MKQAILAQQGGQCVVEDFTKRKTLLSFGALLNLAQKEPVKALEILLQSTQTETPYSDEAAAIFLLGTILGVLGGDQFGSNEALKSLIEQHADMMEWKPQDYIGDRRTYGLAPS
jgi:hypothetical protein